MYQCSPRLETEAFLMVPSIFWLLRKLTQPILGRNTLRLSTLIPWGYRKESFWPFFLNRGNGLFGCFLSKASRSALSKAFTACCKTCECVSFRNSNPVVFLASVSSLHISGYRRIFPRRLRWFFWSAKALFHKNRVVPAIWRIWAV